VPAYIAAFEHAFVFSHPGELLFGTGLLYYSRLFERQATDRPRRDITAPAALACALTVDSRAPSTGSPHVSHIA